MVDNIRIGADASAAHALDLLRMTEGSGPLGAEVELGADLALRADPVLALGGTWRSPPGEVLDLDARPAGPGRWFGLHLALHAGDLTRIGVLGFAMRARMAEVGALRAALRSGTEDGFADAFFDKHVLLRPRESTHLDALSPRMRPDVPAQAPWRELVLFLPTQETRLRIHDLRVFAV